MKRIGVFASIFIAFIIFIPNVKAIDELNIKISANDLITVYDKDNNLIADTNTYKDKFTYSNGKLTFNEGYYFNYVEVDKPVVVTSNSKKIYLNMLYVEGNATIEKLNSESFISDGSHEWDNETINETSIKMLTHMHAKGTLNIIDSDIKLNVENNEFSTQNMIHIVDDYDLTIKNSKIDIDGYLYTSNKKIITIENSEIRSRAVVTEMGEQESTAKIEIKNSELTAASYEIPASYISSMSPEFLLKPSISSYDIVIEDSTLNNVNVLSTNNITIKKCDNSLSLFIATNNLTIEDSNLNVYTIFQSNNIILKNSNITTKDDNNIIVSAENMKMNNSKIDIKGIITSPSIDMEKSFIKIEADTLTFDGNVIDTASALIVYNLKMRNSDFIAISNTAVPAFILVNEIDIDKDNFILVDKNNNILELKQVDLEEYGFFANPNNRPRQMNEEFFLPNNITQAYTGLYNNKASMYVSTSELITYTLKIKNGKWSDGTIEDKTVTLIKGDIPTKELFKSYGIPGYDILTIKKTGDTEYTFVYSKLENPKTGVKSLIIVFYLAIICIALVLKKNKETSYFRRRI